MLQSWDGVWVGMNEHVNLVARQRLDGTYVTTVGDGNDEMTIFAQCHASVGPMASFCSRADPAGNVRLKDV